VTDRFGALGAAMQSEVHVRGRRSFLLAIGAALLAAFALGGSIVPIAIAGNLVITYAVFLAAFGGTLAAALLWQFSGGLGDALAVAGWGRLQAEERRRELGAGRIPRNAAEARAWLASHPDPSVLQPHRVGAYMVAGDLAAARDALASCPAETAYERFDKRADAWFLDFLEGAMPPLDEVESAAEAVTEPEQRVTAVVTLATLRAHREAVAGGDWIAPLAAARPLVGTRADGIVGSRYVSASWTMMMAIAAAMIGGGLLVGRLTGVWL
jgi:hypothetical protein